MDTHSPALHVADSHDPIRVHGARENNLKDVSVELPKRRLAEFTGISGSGKSSRGLHAASRSGSDRLDLGAPRQKRGEGKATAQPRISVRAIPLTPPAGFFKIGPLN
jgi:hypothetical protein